MDTMPPPAAPMPPYAPYPPFPPYPATVVYPPQAAPHCCCHGAHAAMPAAGYAPVNTTGGSYVPPPSSGSGTTTPAPPTGQNTGGGGSNPIGDILGTILNPLGGLFNLFG